MKNTFLICGLLIVALWLIFYFTNRNRHPVNTSFNKPLAIELNRIFDTDQRIRLQLDSLRLLYADSSQAVQAIFKKMVAIDKANLKKVIPILDMHGWQGIDEVGPNGNAALFLVIQHSDLKTQEKYLPVMKQAMAKGKAAPEDLALLEDRVLIAQNKRQKYGSQIGYTKQGKAFVLPLEDPEHVDQRRASVGLGPIAEYLNQWQIGWDAAAYKEELPALEAEWKN